MVWSSWFFPPCYPIVYSTSNLAHNQDTFIILTSWSMIVSYQAHSRPLSRLLLKSPYNCHLCIVLHFATITMANLILFFLTSFIQLSACFRNNLKFIIKTHCYELLLATLALNHYDNRLIFSVVLGTQR